MRLIDADKLNSDVFKCFSQPNYHPDADAFIAMETEKHNEYIHNFLEDIEQQPTIEVPQWIPVEDGQPKKHGYYLATVLDWFGKECVRPILFDNLGFATSGFQEVLAWMELPQPYQKGTQ